MENGVRWWINFEGPAINQNKNGIIKKFNPIPILADLLEDVYTHITPNVPVYAILLHPLLSSNDATTQPNNSLHNDSNGIHESISRSFPGGDVNGKFCLEFTINFQKNKSTLLQETIRTKSITEVQYLIEIEKCDPSELTEDSTSSLFVAAEKGDAEILKYLLNQPQGYELVNLPKQTGATPLHIAAWKGNFEAVELLIANNANVNTTTKPNPKTPLYDAINNSHHNVAELLLNNFADPNIKSINASLPMHAAAFSNATNIIPKLFNLVPAQLNARVCIFPSPRSPSFLLIFNSSNFLLSLLLLSPLSYFS